MHKPAAAMSALAGLLFAAQVLAAAPPPAASVAEPPVAAGSAATPTMSTADQKRVSAIQQYQHDLVTVVALRAEPDYLLGAAILAKPFQGQTPGLDFDSLSQRAAAAPGAGPETHWQRLVACKDKADCPNKDALAYLEKHAADNAAVWIVAMDVAARDKHAAGERTALKKAAAAKAYDDYYGKALAGIAKAVAVLPPLDDTIQGAHDGQPDNPDGVRVLVTLMNMQAYVRPDFAPVDQLCGRAATGKDAKLAAECRKLAHVLQWGSSPVARAMGLRIEGELDPADKASAEDASRDLQWQVQQYSHLLQRSLTDPAQASRWLAAARNGGTELSLILATLRANGVPPDSPAAAAAAPAPAASATR